MLIFVPFLVVALVLIGSATRVARQSLGLHGPEQAGQAEDRHFVKFGDGFD
jgi:hypothetical protein